MIPSRLQGNLPPCNATNAGSNVALQGRAGALLPSSLMTKSEVVFRTVPLGEVVVPGGLPKGGCSGTGLPRTAPRALTCRASPEPLAAISNCPLGVSAKPQGLIRAALVCSAILGRSDSKLVT